MKMSRENVAYTFDTDETHTGPCEPQLRDCLLSAHYWVRDRLYRWAGQHTSPYLRPVVRKTRQLTRLKTAGSASLFGFKIKRVYYCLLFTAENENADQHARMHSRSAVSLFASYKNVRLVLCCNNQRVNVNAQIHRPPLDKYFLCKLLELYNQHDHTIII